MKDDLYVREFPPELNATITSPFASCWQEKKKPEYTHLNQKKRWGGK